MLTLPAHRAVSVLQDAMLREVVVEKEIHEARTKAKEVIGRMLDGLPMDTFGVTYGSFEPPLGEEEAGEVTPVLGLNPNLPDLPPALEPVDDINPFPGLERPVG